MSCRDGHCSGLTVCYAMFCLVSLLLLSGCQKTVNTRVLHEDLSVLEAALASREVELMQLRLQLLQQEEVINRLSSSQEQSVQQEVVRAKARLRSHAGKAETVANIAEVSMMLQSSRETASPAARKVVPKRAEQYLAMSEVELDKENYECAAYLVGKARALVQPVGSSHGVIISGSGASEVKFYSPIRMEVLKVSNVRQEASLQAKVLFRLNASEQVRAIAYSGPWLRIQTGDNRTGWIYHKLLDLVR